MSTSSTGPGGPHGPESRRLRRLRTTAAVAISVAVVLLAALVVVLVRNSQSVEPGAAPPASTAPTATLTPTPGPTAKSTGPTVTTPAPTTTTPNKTPSPATFRYQPLWPFASLAAAEAWQAEANPGGHQPWHLDAAYVALAFTRQYLGFTEIDKVIATSVQGSEAWVSVGYHDPNGKDAVAAVLHLARIGSGSDKPWEVVGSRDSTLSIVRPAYGAKVSDQITVGGRITGVDENIVVQVRQQASRQLIGSAPGVPAGGQDQPWSTRVTITGATAPALTIVASTGGHLQGVERFAITGVRS